MSVTVIGKAQSALTAQKNGKPVSGQGYVELAGYK